MRLNTKLFVAFALMCFIPLTSVELATYYVLRENEVSEAVRYLDNLVEARKNTVEALLEERFERLEPVASSPIVEQFLKTVPEARQKATVEAILKRVGRDFSAVALLDKSNKMLLSNGEISPKPSTGLIAAYPPVRYAEFFRDEEGLRLLLCVPVISEEELLGFVIASRSATRIARTVSDLSGLGRTGEAVLLTKEDGFGIPLTRFRLTGAGNVLQHKELRLLLERREGALLNATDYRSRKVVVCARELRRANASIVLKMDRAEILASLRTLKNTTVATISATALLLLLTGAWVARSITPRIRELISAARRIRKGTISFRAGTTSSDEIGELSESFNSAAEFLIQTKKKLERRIKEDTRELEREVATRKEIEAKYRELFDEAPLGYHEIDSEGRIVNVNRTELRMFGFTAEEMLGRPAWEFVIEEQSAEEERTIKAKLAGKMPRGDDYIRIFRCKDGSTIPVLIEDRFLTDEKGRIVGMRSILNNIQDLYEAQQELARERALLKTLIDNLPDFIFIKDTDSRFLMTNKAHLDILGVERLEDVVGKTDFEFFPQELAEKYYADEQRVVRTGDPLLHRVESVRDGEGKERWLLTTKVPLRDPDGKIVGLVGISRDITELRKAQEELRKHHERLEQIVDERTHQLRDANERLKQYARQLERSNEELQQFAYVASHDLQEPLRTISGFAQLLARRYRGKIDDQADEFIDYIVDGVTRMEELINDLLAYSRVGTRGKPFQSIDSNRALQRAIANLHKAIEEVGAQVTYDTLPTVTADESQLIQLFQNLIGNAIKFRHPERIPSIHISARREGGEWVFSVADNGIGIDPRYFDRIFAIFQRLHTRDQYSGTGIGLAICKRIVQRHGGRIWLNSTPGEGTTFYFSIPGTGHADGRNQN